MMVTTNRIIPPRGGKIHIVSVPVDESRKWKDAVNAAGPDTDHNSSIYKIGGQYPPTAGAMQNFQEVILVNFGKYNMRSKDVLAWGKARKLKPITPRKCFAVGEHCPNLYRDLGLDQMGIVSLVPCSFVGKRQVTCVWLYRSMREVILRLFGLGWCVHDWFGFSRESE